MKIEMDLNDNEFIKLLQILDDTIIRNKRSINCVYGIEPVRIVDRLMISELEEQNRVCNKIMNKLGGERIKGNEILHI